MLLSGAEAAEPPVIPVGFDAYREWAKWPYQRIGARVYMRSTYDRSGGNEGADASHFLYQLSDTNNVTLDVAGRGIICFVRYNHWHGSPWHYVVDGKEHLIEETSTTDPNHPVSNSVFQPADTFPAPLAVTWSTTHGADLSWIPIPFENSFRMEYSRTHYGTGYYIYEQFVEGTPLSQPIHSWDPGRRPDRDILEVIERAGTDISPTQNVTETKGLLTSLSLSESCLLTVLTNAPGNIRKLSFSVPVAEALDFGRMRLRVFWDRRNEPSVEAPVALFFGAGVLYNRDGREYLVKSFPSSVRYSPEAVELSCFFPMPFFSEARIELVGTDVVVSNISWSVRSEPLAEPPSNVGYFHATYRDHPNPQPGEDLVLLDTRTTEGGGDWTGSFIGTSLIFSEHAVLNTLEGDPRFFFDDSQSPQAQGTGTEEWCGGGDYWGGQNMTLAFAGHPTGARNTQEAKNDLDKIQSAYRFLLGDLMPFGKNALIRLEHGGRNESTEHYRTVAYWYGAPAASLIKTDVLKIADPESEASHYYTSPQASAPYEITSRYEWGVDSFPTQTDRGRKTIGTSEFELHLVPKNLGALIRRKLDYAFPNQRAEVYVAPGRKTQEWKFAGIWYLAGANTCVYSNPKDELGTTQHTVQTSNRRFRDDEFLVPKKFTEGESVMRVRIKFTPVRVPLYPGYPLPELAWSEIRYDAYCFVIPDWKRENR